MMSTWRVLWNSRHAFLGANRANILEAPRRLRNIKVFGSLCACQSSEGLFDWSNSGDKILFICLSLTQKTFETLIKICYYC